MKTNDRMKALLNEFKEAKYCSTGPGNIIKRADGDMNIAYQSGVHDGKLTIINKLKAKTPAAAVKELEPNQPDYNDRVYPYGKTLPGNMQNEFIIEAYNDGFKDGLIELYWLVFSEEAVEEYWDIKS